LGSAAQAPNLNLSLNPNLMNTLFDHEKLEIYRESLAFIAWLEPRANSDYRMHEGD